MRSTHLAALLCLFAGCATTQTGPAPRTPDLKVSIVGEGLSVKVAATELPWVITRGKGGTEPFLQFDLEDGPSTLTLMVSPADTLQPALTIFMVQATLLQNGLSVTPLESMNPENTDVRLSYFGTSKAVGRAGGQVRAWIVPGSGKTVVLMGMWPERLQRAASADYATLVSSIRAAEAR